MEKQELEKEQNQGNKTVIDDHVFIRLSIIIIKF